MITETSKKRKQYVCISFFVNRGMAIPVTFDPGTMTVQRLHEIFGINYADYKDENGNFLMMSIFNMINDIINIDGVNLVGVSEDSDSLRYHFVIE